MMKLVLSVGVERFLLKLSTYVQEDFRRWERFDKVASSAAHSPDGVIELMPTSDGTAYGFKYVNGQAAEHGAGFSARLSPKPTDGLRAYRAAKPPYCFRPRAYIQTGELI